MKRLLSILPVLIASTFLVYAQQRPDTVGLNQYQMMIRNAYKAVDAHNWNEAIAQWDYITRMNPVNGEGFYKLGESYFNNETFDKAISAFKKSLKTGDPAPFETACFIARCYAKLHDKTGALNWPQQSFDLG